jgi:beta-phosphoglucomutase
MKYRGVIFDFNGVLLWDIPWHRAAWARLSRELGTKPFSEKEWESFEGQSTKELLPKLEGKELSEKEKDKEERRKDELYKEVAAEHAGEMSLSPGARELLDLLIDHSIPRAIATSASPDGMQMYIGKLRLIRWFKPEHIVCNDGTFPGKPAPDIYRIAAERIGVPIGECIVIEDALSGITAASSAGAGCVIGLGPQGRHEDMRDTGATKTIESLEEVSLADFE